MNELDDISLQFSLINQSHAAAKTNRTSIKCFELCHKKKSFHVFYGQNVLFLPIKLLNMRNFNTGIYQNTFPDICKKLSAKLARNKLKLRKDIVKKCKQE